MTSPSVIKVPLRCLCSEKCNFANIDGYHQLLTNRSVLFVPHVCSSLGGKRDALNRSRFVDILRSSEAARRLDAIVVSPQKVIGTKVEVLLAAVAGDFLGKLHTKPLPRLSSFDPRVDLFGCEPRHCKEKWCG